MTVDDHLTARAASRSVLEASLSDRLELGEPYAVMFGGQGAAWVEALTDLVTDAGLEREVGAVVADVAELLAPVADDLLVTCPEGFHPRTWIAAHVVGDPIPSDAFLTSAAVSVPGIVLAQLAAIRSLRKQGLDVVATPPVAVLGHSQGVLAVEALTDPTRGDGTVLAVATLIGAAAARAARASGVIAGADGSPMVAVSKADPARIGAALADFVAGLVPGQQGVPSVSVRNGHRSLVLSGRPRLLAEFEAHCRTIAAAEADERRRKLTGGAAFDPLFEPLPVQVGFHHVDLAPGVELVESWAARCGIDVAWAGRLARDVLVTPVDWLESVGEAVDAGAQWFLDLGPVDLASRITAPIVRGHGVGVVPAALRGGQRNLFTPGSAPERRRPWTQFAPVLVTLPDGREVVETAFTRLTGRSPMLLAGMTPTTVDPAIVAAAANAGHWAEWAGGGQVTEPIFAENLERLTELLEPGRQAAFNSLFLDPYLWKLQLGGKKLVQKARAKGAPIDGVIVTAGIPELEEAVALVDELREAGIGHVAFKPGTVDQIRAVLRIAAEIPHLPVIVQIEGGRAGGHHSWEDLDDLLVATYGELRARPNVVVCVGGGIGTPERASEYLTGVWAARYDLPLMPLDGILVGTAAMATKEATTSPAVKELLVATPGHPEWIGAGHARGGMASGRSQLGADIHEVDNTASRCGRLLDEVAGDADAVAERRDEIIAALAGTAKPYFGDLDGMSYGEWLRRYAELSFIDGDPVTADITWRMRFFEMLRRAEARLVLQDRGEFATAYPDVASVTSAADAIAHLEREYPVPFAAPLHPADIAFFLDQCKTPGKPVGFVPVVDKDVRRWWRSDSLWQAHDARYGADEVCIIPGTVAVAGITRVDEPVGELLDRFEGRVVADLRAGGAEPMPIGSRRRAGLVEGDGPLRVAVESDDAVWSGRVVPNPLRRLGGRESWTVVDESLAEHRGSGAKLRVEGDRVVAEIPVSGRVLRLPIRVGAATYDGAAPVIEIDDAAGAMTALLTIAAGGELPPVDGDGVAHSTGRWTPILGADHTSVTAFSLPSTFGAAEVPVPDALVGLAWPAVFAAIGAARTPAGGPAVEGLLDLVHLDHAVTQFGALPTTATDVVITARLGEVVDTEFGRVIEVAVTIAAGERSLAEFTERFAIRGRTAAATLGDPVAAGGALGAGAEDTVRKQLRRARITAPSRMNGFAAVSGDRNPIHTDRVAAALAGLGEPIVHGMWLSAAAQQVVTAADGSGLPAPRPLRGWTARYLGMVRLGDEIDVRVERTGIDAGADVIAVTCKVGDDVVMTASGVLAPPRTVYAFPGQGIQSMGMGMAARSRSKAAREIWDRADAHTRKALGFSILAVVRDNPTTLVANGVRYSHPDGVLFLTQFTQVAMATLGVAQMAELTEQGARVPDAITCGHSVGEYNALAACAQVLPLEAVLEVVFQRGSAMHNLVPRDAKGRSDYRMAAIRPSQFGLADDDVTAFVAGVGEGVGEFLEVVNLNLRGSQYAIAGTVKGLEALQVEVERRVAEFGGRRAFILVPGIDVPFHSTVLRDGVPEFRHKLDELLPARIDASVLIGKYVPNLVPRLFNLSREFVQEIADLVPSEPLDAVLADWENVSADRDGLARIVLIELLAWQFASPVRWIETQDLLFTPVERGGLGIDRFVEVGVKSAPTVAGLATNTLKLDQFTGSTVQVLNLERDNDAVLGRDAGAPDADDEPVAPAAPSAASAPAAASSAAPAAAAPAAASGPRPADLAFGPADAVRAVVALWTKMRPDQIGPSDTIESLCDGVSSRRNQLLLDVGTELGLGAIDGAAEAEMTALAATVSTLARGYRPLGSVLSDAVADQVRKVLGPLGKRAAYIAERVTGAWQLGDGWATHATVALALGCRDGASVRGGDLGGLLTGPLASTVDLDALIDRAVESVGAARGVAVALPAAGGGGGGAVVDAAALAEFTDQLTGPDGALASAARVTLRKLGLEDVVAAAESDDAEAVELAERVSAELGKDWLRAVAPAFDARRAVLLDDRWASAREDVARLWLADENEIDADVEQIVGRFTAAGSIVASHATWWQDKALAEGRAGHARVFAAIAAAAEDSGEARWAGEIAVVTGAAKGSIAAAVAGGLLGGGATVVATTSRLTPERLAFFKELYRTSARTGAKLWLVQANMASYADVDALVEWVGSEQTENLGGSTGVVKEALRPTLLFPFAAPRVVGDLTDAGPRAELEMKVLLWSVERLIAGLAALGGDADLAARLHVVLPGSPNRGLFGGDGAYGEAKAALDALCLRWKAESAWNERTTLAHAIIGWVRGTGLMGGNDPLVDAVEAAGVRTWSTSEMAAELLGLCAPDQRASALVEPLLLDLTAGLDGIDLQAITAGVEAPAKAAAAKAPAGAVNVALSGPAVADSSTRPSWAPLDSRPEDLVVIVGAGELGPYGSARTRFEVEVDDRLSAAGVLELAWNTGLITWEQNPKAGWYDVETGDPVAEADIADRYHDAVMERCGIRRYADEGEMIANTSPLLTSVFLDEDVTFTVGSEAEARSFAAAQPDKTVVSVGAEGDWKVTRRAGTEIRVPRRYTLTRTVGGQLPTGFDVTRWGVSPDMAESVDRVALWNLVATVDAFLSSGFSPSELMRWVHPGLVANTQGTGMGGMTSMRSLYLDTLLGEAKPNDILQEALPNVVAAHVVQSYIGSYGAMIHPVAACATAAVSVEEGVDKIRVGKALFAVAGGFDDLGIEGIVGFGDMSATADSAVMAAKGIDPRRFSRANDRRRGGFVESNGGGTVLLARGDVAAQMGLPVLGVVAWAASFGDGVHTSIPAPGLGALGAARGGRGSALAESLASLGVSADDVAVISKHDTSTKANDPNEAKLHTRLAKAIGRGDGAPLFVVSQKTLTGHSKGGAAAFQLIGLCQILRDGVIPPNRSLDCVDEVMEQYPHLVWPTQPMEMSKTPFSIKAGMLTSLGFGHVSGLIAVVHPEAFVATLPEGERESYRERAAARQRDGKQRLLDAMCGGRPAYQRPPNRRLSGSVPEADIESTMLLDPAARLGAAGSYAGDAR